MAREANTTRERRELFQRAIRDNVSVPEARQRVAFERWNLTDMRLATKRAAPAHDLNGERGPRFWYQRD